MLVTGPPAGAEDLDSRIHRVDPDRWLASRFVGGRGHRAEVVALYALSDELARVGESVTNPLAGEIRLAWWRERLEAMAVGGEAPSQPVLLALGSTLNARRLPAHLLDALVEARHADLEAEPFADDDALARYLDGTAGAVMGLALHLLDPEAPLRAVVEAGRAWGLAGLYRARRAWVARGRRWMPRSWGALDEAALAQRVRAEVQASMTAAGAATATLSVQAFPAVAYVSLARAYAAGRNPGELTRRFTLMRAATTGRI